LPCCKNLRQAPERGGILKICKPIFHQFVAGQAEGDKVIMAVYLAKFDKG
jgi:hypothetical protein